MPRGVKLYVAGWAHYRAGDFEKAIERLQQSRAADHRWPHNKISFPLLAMSYHRAGRVDESLAAFNKAGTARETWIEETLARTPATPPVPWFDWIEFLVHYRDACILVKGYAPPDDPRLLEIESRALAAIE